MKDKLRRVAHKAIAKKINRRGMKGEADRFIGVKKPKHLFAGKRVSVEKVVKGRQFVGRRQVLMTLTVICNFGESLIKCSVKC
jgi:hypothetical protein